MNDTFTDWRPPRVQPPATLPGVRLGQAMWRGMRGRCPGCGQTRLFSGLLRLHGPCAQCGAPTDRVRTDDVAPYFTILVAAHVIVGGLVASETAFSPSMLTEALIWIPLTCVATVALLRPVKGAVTAVMLKLDMLTPLDEPADTPPGAP